MRKAANPSHRSRRRRSFLRRAAALGAAGLIAPLLQTCARLGIIPSPNPPQSSTPGSPWRPAQATSTPRLSTSPPPRPAPTEDSAVRIALVRTTDRADGVRRALDLLEIEPLQNRSVFIKPNFNSAHPSPGSTSPELLRALIVALQALDAGAIHLGDRSGMGNTERVLRKLGIFELGHELGFETHILESSVAEDWVEFQPPGSHWQQGFLVARVCLEADLIVQCCCLKTHRFGGHFTLSLKNSVGMVAQTHPESGYDYMGELHNSRAQRAMIAEINQSYSPELVVLDGIEAFLSGGPERGKRAATGVLLAGSDRVALDAVGVALLRHFGTTPEVSQGPIFQQEQIARAVELGLGVDRPQRITILTDDQPSAGFAEQIEQLLLADMQ